MTTHGALIAIEGIDGAGKTTQVELLAKFLADRGLPHVRSKEPTDGVWGQKIRQSASRGRMTLEEEVEAFARDRTEHVAQLIGPALARGDIVLLDRYFYSNIAYQGSRGADPAAIAAVARRSAPEPDAVLLVDVPAEVGLARIRHSRSAGPNAFEDAQNLRSVRQAFLKLAEDQPNIHRVDGTKSIDEVHADILSLLLKGALKAYGLEHRARS